MSDQSDTLLTADYADTTAAHDAARIADEPGKFRVGAAACSARRRRTAAGICPAGSRKRARRRGRISRRRKCPPAPSRRGVLPRSARSRWKATARRRPVDGDARTAHRPLGRQRAHGGQNGVRQRHAARPPRPRARTRRAGRDLETARSRHGRARRPVPETFHGAGGDPGLEEIRRAAPRVRPHGDVPVRAEKRGGRAAAGSSTGCRAREVRRSRTR